MFTVGKFSRTIKSNGTLLFIPFLSDADFLLDANHLFHAELGTEFTFESIVKVSKGFHININSVTNDKDALFFENEIFALPEAEVYDKTIDYFIGKNMESTEGIFIGKIDSFSKTRDYYLLSVEKENKTFMIPFKPEIVKIIKDKIILLREDLLEV